MSEYVEKRAYVRIHLRAYACDKTCTLVVDGRRLSACLVDISVGGARLRLPEALTGPKDQPLVFSVDAVAHGGLLGPLAATVRWRNGPEIGIQFDTPLEAAVGALQRLVG